MLGPRYSLGPGGSSEINKQTLSRYGGKVQNITKVKKADKTAPKPQTQERRLAMCLCDRSHASTRCVTPPQLNLIRDDTSNVENVHWGTPLPWPEEGALVELRQASPKSVEIRRNSPNSTRNHHTLPRSIVSCLGFYGCNIAKVFQALPKTAMYQNKLGLAQNGQKTSERTAVFPNIANRLETPTPTKQ